MDEPTYKIKHEQFEGPLDLLLGLIEKRKLMINEFSLAKITDDYIAHIRDAEKFPLGDSAHFILIASTLVLIKSRSLLPQLKLTEEEENSVHNLEDRLKLYQRTKELSLHISALFGKELLFQPNARKVEPFFSPDESMTLANFQNAISALIHSLPKKEKLSQVVVRKVISLEETISKLTQRITSSLKMSFREFAGVGKQEKVGVIVSFLAMLELVKQGIIQVRQEKDFSDIMMETNDIGVPDYSSSG